MGCVILWYFFFLSRVLSHFICHICAAIAIIASLINVFVICFETFRQNGLSVLYETHWGNFPLCLGF